jgi:hypothetical protein
MNFVLVVVVGVSKGAGARAAVPVTKYEERRRGAIYLCYDRF